MGEVYAGFQLMLAQHVSKVILDLPGIDEAPLRQDRVWTITQGGAVKEIDVGQRLVEIANRWFRTDVVAPEFKVQAAKADAGLIPNARAEAMGPTEQRCLAQRGYVDDITGSAVVIRIEGVVPIEQIAPTQAVIAAELPIHSGDPVKGMDWRGQQTRDCSGFDIQATGHGPHAGICSRRIAGRNTEGPKTSQGSYSIRAGSGRKAACQSGQASRRG